MSVGLFGAYTGSPRIQRAYASAGCTRDYLAVDENSLRTALADPNVTCIEIDGTIPLTQDLPPQRESTWVGSARQTEGLTIFGNGDDTIDGDGHLGIQLTLARADFAPTPNNDPATLVVSDLTLTDFDSAYGAAVYVLLSPPDPLVVPNPQLPNVEVSIDNVTLTNNTSAFSGAAVYVKSYISDAYVTITDSEFTDNAALWGGAVYVFGDDTAQTTITSSTFTRNSALDVNDPTVQSDGGAVFTDSNGYATVTIGEGSRFIYNDATGRGGAIRAGWLGGTIGTINAGEDVTFDGNTAGVGGGALYAQGPVGIAGSVTDAALFTHNQSGGSGGAIRSTGEVTVGTGAAFTNNDATGNGGAISTDSTVTLIGGSILDRNTAGAQGGAVSAQDSVQVGAGTHFSYNESVTWGGAIYAKNSVNVTGTMTHPVSFDHNQAASGGAIHVRDQGGDIALSTFTANLALTGDGGAVLNYFAGPLAVSSSTFEGNAANAGDGGAIWSGGDTVIRGSSVVDNVADNRGGGILGAWGYDVTLENSFVGDNTARRGGGVWLAPYTSGPGDLTLNFTSIYDDTVVTGGSDLTPGLPTPTAVYANNITSTGSVVGSMSTTDIWSLTGAIDDTDSVSTASGTTFDHDVAPGTLGFGPLDGTAPGQLGKTPDATSVLALPVASGGFATATNPLPLIIRDQLGNLRVAPFTIGARSAVVAAPPSVSSVAPVTGSTGGGEPITIHGSGFTGATSASINGTAIGSFAVVDDTTITGVTPTGTAGQFDVSVTGPGGTGILPAAFTFVAPAPPNPNPPAPNPPAPTPQEPASAPQDVRAEAAVESAVVSWQPPASTGSSPVTSYRAVASPGGQACVVSAPALTCTITGLSAGTPYTVTALALSQAGWSVSSEPSATVVPLSRTVPTILITSSRERAQGAMVRIEGTTTGLVGAEVVPYLRMAGQTDFTPGASTRTVDADGNFVWQRKAKKRFTVYFVSGDVTSNRLVIRPE